jgi:hypothetical protein
MRAHSRFATVLGGALAFLAAASARAGNMECLGGDCHGPGYAVYRSSDPGEADWSAVCGDWKTDFVVLNDDRWQKRQERYRKHCPNGTVVYARSQTVSRGLDRDFLAFFDQVIARARAEGRKVLFHCKLGAHRTGRLAAYYELKHEGWSLDRALEDFDEHLPFLTRVYGLFFNNRVRRQIRGIAAFLEDPSVCEGDRGRDCVLSTDRAPKDPVLREAERRLQGE